MTTSTFSTPSMVSTQRARSTVGALKSIPTTCPLGPTSSDRTASEPSGPHPHSTIFQPVTSPSWTIAVRADSAWDLSNRATVGPSLGRFHRGRNAASDCATIRSLVRPPVQAHPRLGRRRSRDGRPLWLSKSTDPATLGTPVPDPLAIQGPPEGDAWRRATCVENPSLLAMSLRGAVVVQEVQSTSTSGGRLSGGAPRSTPVKSLTWPRNQIENSSPEVARSANAFSMSGASNHTNNGAPHRSLLQSPGLPDKSLPRRLSLKPLAAVPHARGSKVLSSLFFTGKDRERAIEHCHRALFLDRPP